MTYIVHSPCCRLLPQVSVWRALCTLSSIPPFLPLSFPFGLVSVHALVNGSALRSLCPLVPACLPVSASLPCPPPSLPVRLCLAGGRKCCTDTHDNTAGCARAHADQTTRLAAPTQYGNVRAHAHTTTHNYSAPAATSPPAPQECLPSPLASS